MKFATNAIHVGQSVDKATGAVVPPLHPSSTFVFEKFGETVGDFEYTRLQNPSRRAWEQSIAALESAKHGFAYASGLASITALLWLLKLGEHIVLTEGCYGGTQRIIEQVAPRYGLEYTIADTVDLDAVKSAVRQNTRLILVETPTNPCMWVTDIAAVSQVAREVGALVAVDNTFLSPYYQRPLELGADITMHSTTKYLGGHSDILGGALATNDDEIAAQLHFVQYAMGAVPSPRDCWLTSRSVKTLEVRMQRHNENARAVAALLDSAGPVKKVFYTGDAGHPQRSVIDRQQLDPYGAVGYGGMLSFEVAGAAAAEKCVTSLKLFALAESLGGVESLICHPYTMTHGGLPPETKQKFGITEGLIRVSVGIENAEDLTADLERALGKI